MTIINSIIKILNDVMVETVIEIFKNDSDPQIKSNNISNVTKINKRDADIAPFLFTSCSIYNNCNFERS